MPKIDIHARIPIWLRHVRSKKAVATLSNQCDNYHKLANRHKTVGIPYPAPITVMFVIKHDCYFFYSILITKIYQSAPKKKDESDHE